jgi:lipopolysaccharide/colanic/teichoic acid biosynthesis glycosyltransferase
MTVSTQTVHRADAMTIKRWFDVVTASAALIIFLPVLAVVAVGVFACIGRPILFRQDRPGLRGAPFRLLKFRTMSNARDVEGDLLPDVRRLTRFGVFLRKTSMDELPELWNVLKGEMSLVGPRPLLVEYLPLYSPEQLRRHEVRPGITGWAQINGRNAVSWEERFALDVWYVDNQSLALDLKILLSTVKKVLMREDIDHGQNETMPRFRGTPARE